MYTKHLNYRKVGMIMKKISIILMMVLIVLSISACEMSNYETPTIPQKYEVTLTLDYERVALTSNSPMNVYVDGEKIGKQEAGTIQDYTLFLEEGEYKFYLKNDGIYKTDEIPFEVTANNRAFDFGAKTRLTFGVEVWD